MDKELRNQLPWSPSNVSGQPEYQYEIPIVVIQRKRKLSRWEYGRTSRKASALTGQMVDKCPRSDVATSSILYFPWQTITRITVSVLS